MDTAFRIRLTASAAVSLVAFVSTAAAERLPRPLGVGHQQLSAGVHVLDLVSREQPGAGGPTHLPRIALTLPSGWFNYDGWGVTDSGGLRVSFWDVDKVYATPCRWQTERKIDPGPTVTGLAAALAARPLRHASSPIAVALGGYRGKYLTWSVPKTADLGLCSQGYFESWTAKGWSSDRYQQGAGQVDRIWILDVEGQRLVIDAAYMPWSTREDRAELGRIVHSIRFLAVSSRKTASPRDATAAPVVRRVTVSDINDRGQIVGGLETRSGAHRGFLWDKGTLTLLGQGPFESADRINGRGQIIGTSSSAANSEQHAVLWEHGKMRDLGFEFGTAINARGQIVGGRFVKDGNNGYTSAPVLWENGKVRDLPFRPGTGSAVNDRGQIVGQTEAGRAVEWQDGHITDLGPGSPLAINDRGDIVGELNGDLIVWRHGVSTDLGPGTPVAINDHGQIIGLRQIAPGVFHAVLWRNGTATDLGSLGGSWSFPTAISNRGQVVGYSIDSQGRQRAFVWQNGAMTRLPSPPPGDTRTRAIGINDENQIIGDGCLADCGLRAAWAASRFAVLWTLTPHGIRTKRILGR